MDWPSPSVWDWPSPSVWTGRVRLSGTGTPAAAAGKAASATTAAGPRRLWWDRFDAARHRHEVAGLFSITDVHSVACYCAAAAPALTSSSQRGRRGQSPPAAADTETTFPRRAAAAASGTFPGGERPFGYRN